jgi:hypothetical protein
MPYRFEHIRMWASALALATLATLGGVCPAAAVASLANSDISWSVVPASGRIRFQLHFTNPDANPSQGGVGTFAPQMYGAFLPDFGAPRNFDIPPMAPGGSFDIFTEFAPAELPASAPVVGGPPAGSPCAPPSGWNGNVHITWNTPGGAGQAFRHMGRVQICPGAPCTFIHIDTDCAAAAPWSVSGLCPGFHVALYEEDRVTLAPNPVPPAWHGWICITADAFVAIPTTCCPALRFDCGGQPGIVELCATTCDCRTPRNPVPGTIDWQTLPDGGTVRFHVRWTNPDAQDSGPITGEMFSQDFGVFRPDFGSIGLFTVPALAPNSFFDVFTDVSLAQLPPSALKVGGPLNGPSSGAADGLTTGPCPPIIHWDGNVDLHWVGAAGAGQVNKHIGVMTVCPGSGASLIHVAQLECDSTSSLPWSVAGLCPGYHATLVNEDKVTLAPNPVPPLWTGYIKVWADAAVPVPDSCCFQVVFTCHGLPGVIDLCVHTCQCDPASGGNPTPSGIDWRRLPAANAVRFHIRWTNPNGNTPTQPITGDMRSQAFGVFLPDAGGIGHFNVPSLGPGGVFDSFFDVALDSLPNEPAKLFPAGNPPIGPPCQPDTTWVGNVDVTWGGPGGTGSVNKHYGAILVNASGGGSYLHVISGCSVATGTTWNLTGGCPGWSITLENENHTPAPAVLPAGWTGWLRFSAPGLPAGATCCALLTFQCGDQNAQIYVCGTVCPWETTTGVGDRQGDQLGFGIRNIQPNPTAGRANVNFALPQAGTVRVEIFDAAGKRVRVLADGIFAPGLHSVTWDGFDTRGERSRPGAYFVRVQSGSQRSAHMIVLRP